MEQVVLIVVTLIISLAFAGILYGLARWRNANRRYWAIMGFLFGPLAIPFVFFAKRVEGE